VRMSQMGCVMGRHENVAHMKESLPKGLVLYVRS
jgi:hypothetical protein